MDGSRACAQCGAAISAEAAWCSKCGYGYPPPRPGVGQRISAWWHGLSRRGQLGIGAAVVVAILVLAAIGVGSGTNSSASNAPGNSAASTMLGVAPGSTSASADQTSASVTGSTVGPSASPLASGADADDEISASAGPSFVASATGIVPPASAASERLPGEPDPTLTPGALNPAVTQATIHSTICVSGWTATIRPSESFTNTLKVKQIGQYGYGDTRTSSYEEDHLVSLELGGAPADPSNLWPEPYTASLADGRPTGAHTKDAFETKLKNEVCAGSITLAQGQADIGDHWVHAYYGIALTSSSTSPAAAATPTAPVAGPPAAPVVSAPAGSLSVGITSLPAAVAHGANATLVAVTSPGATCGAGVTYASGSVSSAAGLQTHPVADSSGTVSWTWKVGSSTGPGTSHAYVTCSLGGESATDSKDFAVK